MDMKRKRIFKFLPLLLIVAGALFVASCSSDDDEVNPLLLNEWVLVSYGNEPNEVLKEARGYFYSITFHSDGTYSGRAYGNEMGGNYVYNGNGIKIIDGDITAIYLVGSDPDKFFSEHLHDVKTYTVSASELRLYYSDNQYFKFRINIK